MIAGSVRLITLNNQIPFHKGTPQYNWALKQFKSVDRDVTPWLFVMVHASPYHTWFKHYKVTLVGIIRRVSINQPGLPSGISSAACSGTIMHPSHPETTSQAS